MSRYSFVLNSAADRARAMKVVAAAPAGTRVEVKASKRTLPQNNLMWSMLTDIAQQVPWHGVRLRPDDYKYLFLDALKRERRMMPNLEGDGFVDLGRSSSDLSKEEMSDMVALIQMFAAKHGVKLHDDREQAA